MAVECERLCDHETPAKAHQLRDELDTLKHDTEQLKADANKKKEVLNQALKVSIRKKRNN